MWWLQLHFETNSADAVKLLNIIAVTVLPHWTVLKVIPHTAKVGFLMHFLFLKDTVDDKFMKNLDVIVDTETGSDHYLVTVVFDTAGLPSTFVPLVKKIERTLKQIIFELLRHDLEQSDLIQLVLQCQNLNYSIVVYNDILGAILEKHASLVEKYFKTSKTPW